MLKNSKGTYCLVLEIKKPVELPVGSLGRLKFRKGIYVYVGSAMNGLEARIKRHFRRDKKIFWHIDYLTSDKDVSVKRAYYKISNKKEECSIAKSLSCIAKPAEKFGCSDCRCKSHLFRIPCIDKLETLLFSLDFQHPAYNHNCQDSQ